MQQLEVNCAVRRFFKSLGFRGLMEGRMIGKKLYWNAPAKENRPPVLWVCVVLRHVFSIEDNHKHFYNITCNYITAHNIKQSPLLKKMYHECHFKKEEYWSIYVQVVLYSSGPLA